MCLCFTPNLPKALNLVKNVGDLKLIIGKMRRHKKRGTVCCWSHTLSNVDESVILLESDKSAVNQNGEG